MKKVFVVANEPAALEKAAHYLERRGYQLTFFMSVGEAVQNLKNSKPDAILLSWNLKGTDVVRVFTVFTHTFNYLCIVFPEDDSGRTVASIVRSRIPNTVLPPLSGPSFERRIESCLRKHEERQRFVAPYVTTNPLREGLAPVYSDEVLPDTVWEKAKLHNSAGGFHEEHSAWKGTADNGHSKSLYYFKGPQMPEYDAQAKTWKNLDNGSPVLREEHYGVQASEYQSPMGADEETFSFLSRNEAAIYQKPFSEEEFTRGMETYHGPVSGESAAEPSQAMTETEAQTPGPKEASKSLLMKCACEALKGWQSTFAGLFAKGAPKKGVTAIAVSTPRFKGYLVFVRPGVEDLVNKAFFDLFAEEMKITGEALGSEEESFAVSVEAENFVTWAEREGFEAAAQEMDGQGLFVSFIPEESFPSLETIENYIGFNHHEWLVEDSTLRFDLYLSFPQNGKFILYLKNGTRVSRHTLGKFASFKVRAVFLHSEQKREFFAYCLENRMARNLEARRAS